MPAPDPPEFPTPPHPTALSLPPTGLPSANGAEDVTDVPLPDPPPPTADANGTAPDGVCGSMHAGFVQGAWLRPRPSRRTATCRPPAPVCAATAGAPVRPERGIPEPGQDFHGIPNPARGEPLRLSDLRSRLIRQEETIIFALIERAQFALNERIYLQDAFDLPDGEARTFLDFLLFEVEAVSAKVRRYTSPDEHPFAPEHTLPLPILERLAYPPTLCANAINVNEEIMSVYRTSLLPRVCAPGDDQNYGSAASADVACLQALSKRVHYGKFIAEAKVQESPKLYGQLAAKGDTQGIFDLLSNMQVEERLLRRVENKASSYGRDITDDGPQEGRKLRPGLIAEMYRDFIIPLTKQVEIEYILVRCAGMGADGEK